MKPTWVGAARGPPGQQITDDMGSRKCTTAGSRVSGSRNAPAARMFGWPIRHDMLSGGTALLPSRMQIPLAAILSQDVVDVDADAADHRSRIRGGVDDALVENCGRVDLATRPGSRLPRPYVAR